MPTMRHDERLFDGGGPSPVGYVITILGDGRQAGQAAITLRDAGFADVVVVDDHRSRAPLQAVEAEEHEASPLARARHLLAVRLADDADARRETDEALRHGHAWVAVHVSDGAQVDQVEGILRAHGALALRFFDARPSRASHVEAAVVGTLFPPEQSQAAYYR